MSTICYSASEIYSFRLSAPKPTRTTRKSIFRLSLWNPDHPRSIPVLSSSRSQNSNMSSHQPNKVLRSRQLREITPTSTKYLSPGCKVGSWNARSVSNKSATIQDYIISERLDILQLWRLSMSHLILQELLLLRPPNINSWKKLDHSQPIL